jgi:hypothetical protein
MRLDLSDERLAGMRLAAYDGLTQWLAAEGIELDGLDSIEIGRLDAEAGGYPVTLRREGRRAKKTIVKEYPPRSLWWYMTEGEVK